MQFTLPKSSFSSLKFDLLVYANFFVKVTYSAPPIEELGMGER